MQYKFLTNNSNPDHFSDPNTFDPERFLKEKHDQNFVFTPFSAGGRNCIGQHLALIEAKVILARILSAFRVGTVSPYYHN